MVRLFNYNEPKIDIPQVEHTIYAHSNPKRLIWITDFQLGFVVLETPSDILSLMKLSNPQRLNIIPYNYVVHPNTYFTVVTNTIPESWVLLDILDALNAIYLSPFCHFIGGKQYHNKHSESGQYAFLWTDNRDLGEMLIKQRKIILFEDPYISIIVKQAPDRNDVTHILKLIGKPDWYDEDQVKSSFEHYSILGIDYVFLSEDHISRKTYDYGFVKFKSLKYFTRTKEISNRTKIMFHDT